MTKQEIRSKIHDMRRQLTSKSIEDASVRVYEQLVGLNVLKDAKCVMTYSNFDNEIKTGTITGWLLFHGKEVCLPVIHNREMYAADIKSAPLELSVFGTAQPNFSSAKIIAPSEIDAVLVPGIAFDKDMERIGFGKGYYDEFLKKANNAVKIALAYDFQIIDSIEPKPYDLKMDMIVTPDGILSPCAL